jgi:hypothetical protein
MEFEFKTTTIATSTKEIYFLSQDDVEQNSFRLRLTSLNSISSAFDGSGYSGAVPNTAFYSSYQKFTWTRKRSVSNANFSALNFYYNDILFRSHNISSTMTPPDSTAIMALGRFTTGTADYVVKNIKIGIWND